MMITHMNETAIQIRYSTYMNQLVAFHVTEWLRSSMTACCRSYSAGQEPRSYGHPIASGNPDVGQKKFQLSCSYEHPPTWKSNLTFEHGNSTSWILSALSGEMSPIKSVPNSNCEPLQIHHHEIQGVNPFNKI